MQRMHLLVASFPTKAVCALVAVCARKLDQSVPLHVADANAGGAAMWLVIQCDFRVALTLNASRVNAGSLNALPCVAIWVLQLLQDGMQGGCVGRQAVPTRLQDQIE